MKTLNKTIVLVLLALIPLTAHASKMLKEQVEAVEATYRGASDISTEFTQRTFVYLLDKTVTKKGKMYFKKGGKFRIQYDGKNEKCYVSDGNILWVFVPGDNSQLVTYRLDDEAIPKEALKFLNGFSKLQKDFRIKPSKTFTYLEPGQSAFYLKPKSKKAHFKALDAKFDLRNLLEDLKVFGKSGNISDYHFTNIKTSTGLPNSLFTYGSGKNKPARSAR